MRAARCLALLFAFSIVAFSCVDQHGPRTAAIAISERPAVGPACQRAVVSAGLGFWWERLNHRISLWRISPLLDTCPDELPGNIALELAAQGGSYTTGRVFSDIPWYVFDYFLVDSPHARFIPGRVELDVSSPDFTAEQRVELTLLELPGFTPLTAAALINGIEINTGVDQTDPEYPAEYDPTLGYTSKGLGARISAVELEPGRVSFTAWVRFEPAPADREDMNAAVPHSRIRVTIDYLLVLIDAGAISPAHNAYALRYDKPRSLREQRLEHASAQQRRLAISGRPGLSTAFVGLTGFDWRLFPGTRGDYLRELSCRCRLVSYDPRTGAATVDLDGFASHASIIAYEAMLNDFSAEVALIQLPAGSAQQRSLSGSFSVGSSSIPLAFSGN